MLLSGGVIIEYTERSILAGVFSTGGWCKGYIGVLFGPPLEGLKKISRDRRADCQSTDTLNIVIFHYYGLDTKISQ